MNPIIYGLLARHALTFIGGYFGAQIDIDAPTAESIGGGVAALVSVVWSVYEKKKRV